MRDEQGIQLDYASQQPRRPFLRALRLWFLCSCVHLVAVGIVMVMSDLFRHSPAVGRVKLMLLLPLRVMQEAGILFHTEFLGKIALLLNSVGYGLAMALVAMLLRRLIRR